MSTLIFSSEVEMTWRLMPRSASVANIVCATPGRVRMPSPTIETLATFASATIESNPISFRASSMARTARSMSRSTTVNV